MFRLNTFIPQKIENYNFWYGTGICYRRYVGMTDWIFLEYRVLMKLPLPSEMSINRQKERHCFKTTITMVAKVMSGREGEIK